MTRYFIAICLGLVLAACSTPSPQPAVYDLGPPAPRSATAPAANIQLIDVDAPPWLEGPGLAYRLDYRDAYRREFYRDSRWAAPPAQLLAERLRQRSAGSGGTGAPVQLRLELEECTQVFSGPGESRLLLRLRVWRVGDPAPRVFESSEAAASADAPGAVRAAGRAADALIDQVLAWAAATR
ncbi:ABC-type transport auxiliary lipoprotein family protein [Pelomonas sp. KK5]|uniref:ABC-type transport auxiliary lipoprotein family protein n=1 Tax=Pelomonas sp. KK5 TaxID=1855730 RepID=UPI00097C57D0|nr:ABC-type transport auxiliary lipoprotein family protein [Pelomonas sp. KK5]